MENIVSAAVTGLFALIVCVIEIRGTRDRKKTDARAAVRAQESRLSMQMQNANAMLGIVTAKAVTHQHTNGDVEEAIEAAEKAKEAYRLFVEGIASEHVTKV